MIGPVAKMAVPEDYKVTAVDRGFIKKTGGIFGGVQLYFEVLNLAVFI